MTITAGDDSFISTDIVALFVIKQVNVDGTMVWRIVAWQDDIVVPLLLQVSDPGVPGFVSTGSRSGSTSEEATWGAIRFVFR